MSYYDQLDQLKYNATLEKYERLETMQEDFRISRKAFNIALLDYIQNEFSNDIQVLDCLDSSCFSIRVISTYWSDYRQSKLDKLEETLKGLVKTLDVIPEFIPELISEDGTIEVDAQNIFKVSVSHKY